MAVDFCFITPAKTEFLQKYALQGDRLFCLANLAKRYESYADFFRKNDRYKIMDTGIVEGEPIFGRPLLNLAWNLNIDEIWAPDILFKKDETIKATTEFLDLLGPDDLKKFRIALLPQGENLKEFIDCYNALRALRKNYEGLKTVFCFSKYATPEAVEPHIDSALHGKNKSILRAFAMTWFDMLGLIDKKEQYHMAGADIGVVKELRFYSTRHPEVRSMDTNLAFKLGVHKIKLSDSLTEEPKARFDFHLDKLDSEQERMIQENINIINQVKKGL